MTLGLYLVVEGSDALGEVAGVGGIGAVASLFIDKAESEVHDEVDGDQDEHSEVEQVEEVLGGFLQHLNLLIITQNPPA